MQPHIEVKIDFCINPPIRGSIADLEEGKIVLHASLNPPIRGSIEEEE